MTTCTALVGEYSRVWVYTTHYYYLIYDINKSATVTLDDAGTCKKHVLKRVGQKQVDLHRLGTVTGPWQNRGKAILWRGKAKLYRGPKPAQNHQRVDTFFLLARAFSNFEV